MRQTSGIIINNDIFINSSHVVKIKKFNIEPYTNKNKYKEETNDSYYENETIYESEYLIDIYINGVTDPINLTFDNENDRDVIFNRIIMEMYGHNYAILNFETKK